MNFGKIITNFGLSLLTTAILYILLFIGSAIYSYFNLGFINCASLHGGGANACSLIEYTGYSLVVFSFITLIGYGLTIIVPVIIIFIFFIHSTKDKGVFKEVKDRPQQ